ncbi:hypothetical protein BLJAPNOD_02219 [Ensifer sp. M14]|jgi:hypothetical protein|nr:hypothetical protein BLJAPNOD_02219 [Ensifer sp. M14]
MLKLGKDVTVTMRLRRREGQRRAVVRCRVPGDAPASANLTQEELGARGLVSLGYRTITINAPAQLRRFVG